MEHGRTARRYRFLMPAQGTGYVGTLVLNLFVGLMVLGAMLGMFVALRAGFRNVSSRNSELYRLVRPLTGEERAMGRVRGAGTFRGADGMGLCLAEHQHYVSGKNGGWRTDSGYWFGNRLVFEYGTETFSVSLSGFEFDPGHTIVADAETEAYFRRSVSFPVGGRVVFQCARPGALVFAEGCVSPTGRLGECSDGTRTALTLGNGTPDARIRKHASETAAQLAAGLALLALVALYVFRVLRAGAAVDALRSWNAAPPTPSRVAVYVVLALVAVLFWIGLAVASSKLGDESYVFGYVIGAFIVAGTACAIVAILDRRTKVRLAMEPIVSLETSRLARVGDGLAELAVRVRRDAPTVQLPNHSPRAFVRVSVRRAVQSGRNVVMVPVHTASWPSQVPVEDPTGSGLLDLTRADLDLRATFRTLSGNDAVAYLAALAQTPFGDVGLHAPGGLTIDVEENYLDAGESLYLMGRIHRVEDPNAASTYRAMGTLPVIAAQPDARLVAFAGNERSLLATLQREHAYLTGMAAAIAALSALLVGALAFLRALA